MITELTDIARLLRRLILESSTAAGSGHPSSSLSAVELMTALCFAPAAARGPYFRYDPQEPGHPNNDRLLFSKGHASPLFYALWAVAGELPFAELREFRRFHSPLEGHPTPRFRFTEAATGSLGQGLSIGLGLALNARYLDKLPYRTFVLLGDSEMAEGAQWEALQLAAHYRLDNLIGILDVNRLGQRGETLLGHDIEAHARRIAAFGWHVLLVEDGHDLEQILAAYDQALTLQGAPVMLVARTRKGAGVSLLEDQDGWHGKPLNQEQCRVALTELGETPLRTWPCLAAPEALRPAAPLPGEAPPELAYEPGQGVATREAYGRALARLAEAHPELVVLDAEVSNSTLAELFKRVCPERFFEMYVAEQNMVGTALGLSLRGKKPCVSSFAAFLTRAADQLRMARYSEGNLLVCGSHAGVSIGEDGASQMGLEDLALFRAILDAAVLYPSDAVSCERLVEQGLRHRGLTYLRTTRGKTPVLYDNEEAFPLGGSKVLRASPLDRATVVAAGITLHEALAAARELAREGLPIRVLDCYSIQPLDVAALRRAARETGLLLTVEDHYAAGGLGEAVLAALAGEPAPVHVLAVRVLPHSGTPEELLDYAGISRRVIAARLRELLA